jgi:hypothetical protein
MMVFTATAEGGKLSNPKGWRNSRKYDRRASRGITSSCGSFEGRSCGAIR